MMPGMDGLETCRRMRRSAELNDPVIIMVSAKAMPSEKAAGMTAGANDYITKPFDEAELSALLHQYTSSATRTNANPTSVKSVVKESV